MSTPKDSRSPTINPHRAQYSQLPKNLTLTPSATNASGTVGSSPCQGVQGVTTGNDTHSQASSVNNTMKVKHRKKRPQIQKTPSYSTTKYVYSVDDDVEELERDLEREYLEGYNDALRYRYKKSLKGLKELGKDDIQNLTQGVVQNLINADNALSKLEQREGDAHRHHSPQVEVEAQEDEPTHEPVRRHSEFKLHDKYQQVLESHVEDSVHDAGNSKSDDRGDSGKKLSKDNEEGEEQGEVQQQDDDDDDDDADVASLQSQESFTLRERQDAINETHPFGIRIWKPALYKKVRSVEREADKDIHETGASKKKITWEVYFTNVIWSVTFGLLFFILCTFGSAILAASGSTPYAKVLFNLGKYLLWPFGKIVYLKRDSNYLSEDRNEGTTIREYVRWRNEEHSKLFFSSSYVHPTASDSRDQQNLTSVQSHDYNPQRQLDDGTNDDDDDQQDRKLRLFGRGEWSIGRVVFYLYFYLIIQPLFWIIGLVCWLLVFTIPMAKVLQSIGDHLRRHPLAIFYKFDSTLLPSDRNIASTILVCTYRCFGLHYYKYTVEGTNIFFINLMFVVIMTIVNFFLFKEYFEWESVFTDETVIFAFCLLSIIPLAYFIGQAVASISAQSSMGVGAVINAFFSTVVEIFLYCVALNQGKGLLVEGSLVGSVLGAVLLLPGLSMCAGAFIRKTQRYNPASASVSCTMLLFSICVMFAPTVFHQIYGSYEVRCTPCDDIAVKSSCQNCHFFQPPLQIDHFFSAILKPFSIICAILLFLAYTIGLWFTLRTHAALIWSTPITDSKPKLSASQISVEGGVQPTPVEQAEPQGHDAPNWSRSKSTIVLLGATLLYAVIAEILVDCVDAVLQDFPINPKLLGLTIFALVPNTTEFLNAISFAMHGNVALSMEIGSAYALQVCLLQIPSLVLYSLFFINPDDSNNWSVRESMFTLIFPNWDVAASAVSVVLFTYIYAEGKSNYFKGSILVLVYVIGLIGFYFTGVIATSDGAFTKTFTIMA